MTLARATGIWINVLSPDALVRSLLKIRPTSAPAAQRRHDGPRIINLREPRVQLVVHSGGVQILRGAFAQRAGRIGDDNLVVRGAAQISDRSDFASKPFRCHDGQTVFGENAPRLRTNRSPFRKSVDLLAVGGKKYVGRVARQDLFGQFVRGAEHSTDRDDRSDEGVFGEELGDDVLQADGREQVNHCTIVPASGENFGQGPARRGPKARLKLLKRGERRTTLLRETGPSAAFPADRRFGQRLPRGSVRLLNQ